MPGDTFFASEPEYAALRLNFSHSSAEEIRRGVSILADLINTFHSLQDDRATAKTLVDCALQPPECVDKLSV